MPKVIGIIPARYASRRFPGKALATLGGLPIVVRVYNQAKKATIFDDVIVATDDQRIFDTVSQHDGKVVMTTGNYICGSERVAAVAKDLKADIFVNIQGDEPLISPQIIEKVANCLIDNPKALMSTACSPITDIEEIDNPNVVKVVMDKNNRALYFSRSRVPWFETRGREIDLKTIPIFHHFGIYGFTAEFLQKFRSLGQSNLEIIESLEQLRALENGYDIYCVSSKQIYTGIDSQEDLFKAEQLLEGMR
ncbi:MAG: 3-deoxy-manno-octulosonate cytidylyltransferase [candidate division Zixibacteria bacterium]|nr:3-deoxy-manno-octulosonate cytidylyltransferase [candidate division Zixibacteria bacterium]